MYNHDGQNLFVIDGHMHFWDANPENWKNKYGQSWIKCFHAFHSGLSPAEEVWPFDAQWTFAQAWGKAPQYDPNADPELRPALDVSRLTPEQRQQLRELLDLARVQRAVSQPEEALSGSSTEPVSAHGYQ